MRYGKRVGILLLVGVICCVPFLGQAQNTASPPVVSKQVQQAAETAVDQALTYIDSVATYLGQGVVYLLNLITNNRLSSNLEKPIGYLALITLMLLLFGLLHFARRIIWIGIILGWALLIVRVVLDAVGK